MTRYTFDEVRAALRDGWGLSLRRGGDRDDRRDGRWGPALSRTGFVVGGQLPRRGYGYERYRSLADVVCAWDLGAMISGARR